ncbi:hypothetical protein E3N88_09605 [Mikania micrantha]|uniref:Retrotransposon Copia-like N-terminal domain-containing protein n=1 Tax=Mikania micrantha TaxID=192012 RepID=A0A5N6PJH8_9ASTR|nr:hypothetical protein E3N88_09605 [Mikania micrantha]
MSIKLRRNQCNCVVPRDMPDKQCNGLLQCTQLQLLNLAPTFAFFFAMTLSNFQRTDILSKWLAAQAPAPAVVLWKHTHVHHMFVKLSGQDMYDVWRIQMLCMLESHDMFGFIRLSTLGMEQIGFIPLISQQNTYGINSKLSMSYYPESKLEIDYSY